MTSWREKLQKASFRGVEFEIQATSDENGRQVTEHFFPTREAHLQEDLGRKSAKFTLNGYVIGDDYFAARDALKKACIARGPGQLVHPYDGTFMVVCTNCRITQNVDNGRMARFEMSFVESSVANENSGPIVARIDTQAQVISSSNSFLSTVKDQFKDSFSVNSVPSFVQNAADGNVTKMLDVFRGSNDLTSTNNPLRAEFVRELSSVVGKQSELINSPSELADTVQNLVSRVGNMGDGPQQNIKMLTSLTSFGKGLLPVNPTTPSRTNEKRNQDALLNLVNLTVLAERAVATSKIPFDSAQAATKERDILAKSISTEMTVAANEEADQSYLGLQNLKAATVRDLTDRAAQLPKIVERYMSSTQPAFVIAHQLYADTPANIAAMTNDIMARNNLSHGGFVAGGESLEVLSHG